MRIQCFMLVFLFILTSCVSASNHDPNVEAFISDQGEFVQLSDTKKLPEIIRPHQDKMIDYLASLEMESEDCYVWLTYLEHKNDSLKIPIKHYDGFVKDYERSLQQNTTKEGMDSTAKGYSLTKTLGNSSGKDGTVLINTKSNSILSYLLSK